MNRERGLKVVLVLVGLLFLASILGLLDRNMSAWAQMIISIYATLGAFLLLAVRNPSANRSLIAFTAWSSFAHGGVMAVQALKNVIPRADLVRAVLPMLIVGVLLIALAPKKQPAERAAAVGA
jgi:FtsH-binding integral membrane protein